MQTVLGRKLLTLVLLWGPALLISWQLRLWGERRPDPLEPDGSVVALLVFGPAVVAVVVTVAGLLAGSRTAGEGESGDCEQESR